MLIPKFSIRQLLLSMIAVGVVSACMAGASRGNTVAFGLSIAIIGLVIPFVMYAAVHWMAFVLKGIRAPVIDRLFVPELNAPLGGEIRLDAEQPILDQTREGQDEVITASVSDPPVDHLEQQDD